MAHRLMCNPLDSFWNFPLDCLLFCHANYAMIISPNTNISRPLDLMLYSTELAKWVAKAARDALLTAGLVPW